MAGGRFVILLPFKQILVGFLSAPIFPSSQLPKNVNRSKPFPLSIYLNFRLWLRELGKISQHKLVGWERK